MLCFLGEFSQSYAGLLGIIFVLGFSYALSSHRKAIKYRLIATALLVQFGLSYFILKTSLGFSLFSSISHGFEKICAYADEGISFVFGNLAKINNAWGFIFAVKVLPIIIFFGALMALLFHLGIVQKIVKCMAFVMRPLFGTSGAETLSVAANSALGQTEAPLLIKNYLPGMTRSELLTVMTSGMAHLSGSILAVYGIMGVPILHLLAASIVAIPGSILISKMMIPETETPQTLGGHMQKIPVDTHNVLDALSSGTRDGLGLAVNVAAMLISFISLVALFNGVLVGVTSFFIIGGISLDQVFGYIFYGVAYMIGIPLSECSIAGKLLGQKLVINEFFAYCSMLKEHLSPRTIALMTYALAGFANISSIGIQIGGIGAICPDKRKMLTQLGPRALLCGTLANILNAAIASLLM